MLTYFFTLLFLDALIRKIIRLESENGFLPEYLPAVREVMDYLSLVNELNLFEEMVIEKDVFIRDGMASYI